MDSRPAGRSGAPKNQELLDRRAGFQPAILWVSDSHPRGATADPPTGSRSCDSGSALETSAAALRLMAGPDAHGLWGANWLHELLRSGTLASAANISGERQFAATEQVLPRKQARHPRSLSITSSEGTATLDKGVDEGSAGAASVFIRSGIHERDWGFVRRSPGRPGLMLVQPLLLLVWVVTGLPARADWTQWRGPNRDGTVATAEWAAGLSESELRAQWRVELGPSYSGPIVAGDRVFVTETTNRSIERVTALDRRRGIVLWQAEWEGMVKVPFFAKANGDWIRATPAFDEDRLYVAGMRDVLVCLDAHDGRELWRVDFVKQLAQPVPAFGFVSSPLVAGDAVYVQAGAGFVKLDKRTGRIVWRTLADEGGMWGSAFSSPAFARLAETDQIVVQTREKLVGVAPADGRVLWEQTIPAFRGMNILTPVILGDTVFTSAYGGKAHQFRIRKTADGYAVEEVWTARTEAYMSTPVIKDGNAYLHLRNQRVTCVDLTSGRSTWTTDEKFGKYWSLVANGNRLLALDERGLLYLLALNPDRFELLSSRRVADGETWAHLAVAGRDLFVRDLAGLTAYQWQP
jgi:outer membrane protein assembly factor BamB